MTESKWEVVPSGMQNGGCSTTGMQNKSTSLGVIKTEGMKNDQFPVGMRVLVVDDDPICLMLLERLLKHCNYQATTCSNALSALELLRANRENFDLVISDVHMPDMDGFKLLELVGLEMDLPVIMMSANGETSAVMKGIMHGACDYLLKPVRAEELRNIWQHVVRKKNKNTEQTLSCEEAKHKPFSTDDGDLHTSGMSSRKRKDNKEEEGDGEQDENDPSPSKKPRVVWSIDLHQQFVNAVNQLGIDKAVPKRVLELMNVQGLTRENVASHLQKYRLYLKRINGHQQGSMDSPFMGVLDSSFGLAMDGGSAACLGEHNLSTPQLSQEALISSLHAGLLGKLNATNLQFASNQGLNNSATMRALFGQSLQHSQPLHHVQPSISLPPHSSQDLGQHSLGQPLHHGQPSTSLPPHSGQDLSQHSLGLSHLQDNLATSIGLGGMHGIDNSIVENALIMEMLERGHNIGDDACIQNANQLRPGSVSPLAVSSFLSDHLGNPPQSLNKGVFHGLSGSLPILSNSKASPSLIPSRHCNELDIVDMNRLGSHGLATPSGVVHDLGGKVSSWQAWDSHSSLPSQKLGHIPAPSSLLTTQLNNASTTKGLIDRFSVGEQGLQGGSILSHHHHHHHHNEPSPSIVGADGSGSINSSSRSILYHSEPLAASVEWKGKEGLLHPSSTSKVDNLALSESFQPWTIF